jgi:TrmH family RNA methyltransferase
MSDHTTHITSRQNARVKDAAKLRLRRQRERQQRCLVDGAREVLRALAEGVEFAEAFLCEPLLGDDAESRDVVLRLHAARVDVATTTEEVFEKLCFGERTGGVIAVARTPRRSIADLRLPERPLIAVLEAVEKPGNLGAVLRSADGAGFDAVIVADPRTDLFNPSAIRASVGTAFSPRACTAAAAEAAELLARLGVPALAALPGAKTSYCDVDYRAGAAIVLGSEAEGLSDAWKNGQVTPISLPMLGVADSLNVSAAAAVLFYEARRQRGTAAD